MVKRNLFRRRCKGMLRHLERSTSEEPRSDILAATRKFLTRARRGPVATWIAVHLVLAAGAFSGGGAVVVPADPVHAPPRRTSWDRPSPSARGVLRRTSCRPSTRPPRCPPRAVPTRPPGRSSRPSSRRSRNASCHEHPTLSTHALREIVWRGPRPLPARPQGFTDRCKRTTRRSWDSPKAVLVVGLAAYDPETDSDVRSLESRRRTC